MKLEDLEKRLKKGILDSLYLLYGEEKYLLECNLKKIINLFGKTIKGINYVSIDENDVKELIPNIETPSFGFEKKLIVVKNSGLFKKEARSKDKKNNTSEKGKIIEYLKNNFENVKTDVILVFAEDEADNKEFVSFIEKNGIVCNFELQKPIQIQSRLKAITNAYKVNISAQDLNYFIECAGTNMQDLINEIRKLIEYAGENGTITKQDIDELTIKKIESIIFDLTDSLGKKQTKRAIETLRNLIIAKEPIQKILITLYGHFKKLYLAKLALKDNIDIIKALDLKPNQTFLVNKYKGQAGYFNENEIRRILKELIDLDYKYKIGLIDLNIGFESILCAYC